MQSRVARGILIALRRQTLLHQRSMLSLCRPISRSHSLHTSNALTFTSPVGDPENRGLWQAGVNFDTLGSWNNRINMAVDYEQSILKGSLIPHISLENVGTATLLGRRSFNEDRCLVTELSSSLQLFGIFDGHGGAIAVDFVFNHVVEYLSHWLERGETDLQVVLQKGFAQLNDSLTRHLALRVNDFDPASSPGTTATVCFLRNGVELVMGHVGDSRAILCRRGEKIRLSTDHVPSNEVEKQRIKKCGGRIITSSIDRMRVNGRLEMTRSLGDVTLKPFGVIAEPETRSFGVKHGVDAFLLLISDGVHFVLSDQELVNLVSSCNDPREAAAFVTDHALHFGSEDNASAVVVPFGAWGKYATNSSDIKFGFGRNLVGGRDS